LILDNDIVVDIDHTNKLIINFELSVGKIKEKRIRMGLETFKDVNNKVFECNIKGIGCYKMDDVTSWILRKLCTNISNSNSIVIELFEWLTANSQFNINKV